MPSVGPTGPFKSTFDRYEQPLMRYATRLLRDRERARDVVQDTFLRWCESDVTADDPRLGAWLFTVCRNRAIDVQRREGRLSPIDTAPEPAVDANDEEQQTVREVLDRMQHLPEKKARVLELRYRHGHSYREIASTTGMTVSHVGVVIHECIGILRKHLAVVAALALLVGAGAWGVHSSRRASVERCFMAREEPRLPLYETGEPPLPPEDDGPIYGPEPEGEGAGDTPGRPEAAPRRAPALRAPKALPQRGPAHLPIDAFEPSSL